MKKPITVWQCECEKCNAVWTSRTERIPKMCPSCKSVNWDKLSEIKANNPKQQKMSEIFVRPIKKSIPIIVNMTSGEKIKPSADKNIDTDFDFGN